MLVHAQVDPPLALLAARASVAPDKVAGWCEGAFIGLGQLHELAASLTTFFNGAEFGILSQVTTARFRGAVAHLERSTYDSMIQLLRVQFSSAS